MEIPEPATPARAIVQSADSANALVLDLAGIDADAVTVVGGKAANLGVLIRAGLPVSPGVSVTTSAYRQVAARVQLDKGLDALATTLTTDVARLSTLAGEARAVMLAAPVSDAVCGRRSHGGGPRTSRSCAADTCHMFCSPMAPSQRLKSSLGPNRHTLLSCPAPRYVLPAWLKRGWGNPTRPTRPKRYVIMSII